MAKALIGLLGLVLALFQITLQKITVGAIKLGLRVLVMSTREHASQNQKKEGKF